MSVIRVINEDAQLSPSVCNRQSPRVYYSSTRKIKAIPLQNGNRGFGHLAAGLFVVMGDLSVFEGVNERNQVLGRLRLICNDLTIFLELPKIGACPLNWCV